MRTHKALSHCDMMWGQVTGRIHFVTLRISVKIFVPVIKVLPLQQVTQISAGLIAGTKNFQCHTKQNCHCDMSLFLSSLFSEETCHNNFSPSMSRSLSFNLALYVAYQPTCHTWLVNMPLSKVLVPNSCQDNELYYSFPLG